MVTRRRRRKSVTNLSWWSAWVISNYSDLFGRYWRVANEVSKEFENIFFTCASAYFVRKAKIFFVYI